MFCVAQHHECYYTKSTRICQHFFELFHDFFRKKFFKVAKSLCLSSKNRSTMRISGFYLNYDFLYVTCDFFYRTIRSVQIPTGKKLQNHRNLILRSFSPAGRRKKLRLLFLLYFQFPRKHQSAVYTKLLPHREQQTVHQYNRCAFPDDVQPWARYHMY